MAPRGYYRDRVFTIMESEVLQKAATHVQILEGISQPVSSLASKKASFPKTGSRVHIMHVQCYDG